MIYNTLDNNKNPTSGLNVNFGQDFAGLGGDSYYIRSALDFHSYYEPISDLVSILHLQAGNMIGLQKCPTTDSCVSNDGYVSMLNDFKMGPNLVRGFAPAGLGPRDITPGTSNDLVGGTMYWGASLEFDYPLYFLPEDSGFTGAVFMDSGSVWGYKAETSNPATGEINGTFLTTGGPLVVLPPQRVAMAARCKWLTMPMCACRPARASSGTRHLVRCGSISPIRS